MKKKVTFEKKINFPTMIGDISSISLEPYLKFIDSSNVDGYLLLSGTYKMTEASRLEDEFRYEIPIEIALTEVLDLNTVKIDISDFTYEIQDEDILLCHIELLVEGLEKIEEEVLEEDRECDDKPVEKEIEIPRIEPVDEVKSQNRHDDVIEIEEVESSDKQNEENISQSVNSLFLNFDMQQETYGTFLVYIVQQNESIHSILEKYHTSLEEVEKYNDLSNMTIGSKIIIPLLDES